MFCILLTRGPESSSRIPCSGPGKLAVLFNDYLGVKCFLCFSSRDVVITRIPVEGEEEEKKR